MAAVSISRVRRQLTGLGVMFALALACCASSATAGSLLLLKSLKPAPAPSGWRLLIPKARGSRLWYPPSMKPVSDDPYSVSAAIAGPRGSDLLYLNAGPKTGDETLNNWPSFRISHIRVDHNRWVREDAKAFDVPFRGGQGSCVIDDYVTDHPCQPLSGDRLLRPGSDRCERNRRRDARQGLAALPPETRACARGLAGALACRVHRWELPSRRYAIALRYLLWVPGVKRFDIAFAEVYARLHRDGQHARTKKSGYPEVVMSMAEQLSIRWSRDGGVVRLTPLGELDLATAPILEQACEEVLGDDDAKMIVVDLTEIEFMDSTALHLLLRVSAACRDADRLRVVNGTSAVVRLFDLAGVRDLLPIISSDQDPLAPIPRGAAAGQ